MKTRRRVLDIARRSTVVPLRLGFGYEPQAERTP